MDHPQRSSPLDRLRTERRSNAEWGKYQSCTTVLGDVHCNLGTAVESRCKRTVGSADRYTLIAANISALWSVVWWERKKLDRRVEFSKVVLFSYSWIKYFSAPLRTGCLKLVTKIVRFSIYLASILEFDPDARLFTIEGQALGKAWVSSRMAILSGWHPLRPNNWGRLVCGWGTSIWRKLCDRQKANRLLKDSAVFVSR